jgi:uncharacterized protein YdeI (YjbR/CyaY-like superfamily)
MTPIFFPTQHVFREWLEKNHDKETELLVGFYKVNSGKPSMNWSQSVDEALCFGWIDGVRRSVDAESYSIRFTPRKPKSIWSAVNIAKVAELTEKGLMQSAGITAFEKRQETKSKIYAYENETKELSNQFEEKFKANKTAWNFFKSQAPSYKKTMIYWIMTAKQDATKLARLEKTIAESEQMKRMR